MGIIIEFVIEFDKINGDKRVMGWAMITPIVGVTRGTRYASRGYWECRNLELPNRYTKEELMKC